MTTPDFRALCAALAHWGNTTPRPIPVTERLPGNDDTDRYGDSWWYEPNLKCWRLREPTPFGISKCSHWLPAHALPLPEVEE